MASSPITLPPGYSVEAQPQGSSLPEGYTVEGNQPAAPSMLSKAGAIGTDLAKGVGEGALDTVHGVGEIIRRGGNLLHAGAGDAIVPPEGQAAVNQLATPTNLTQKIGKTAEDIGEFVLGDEAMKSLPLGKRALEAAGLAEKYEKASPFVRKAIEHTINGMRQGGVAGAETTVKTGDVKQGAEAGLATAAGSVALGAVGETAKAVKGALTLPKAPVPISAPVLPAAVADVKTVQPILQNGIKKVLSDAADEIGVTKPSGASFRDAAKELGDTVFGRSKNAFTKIDEVTNGEFTNVDNKIKNLNKEMRLKAGVNDAADQLMGQQKQVLESKMQDLLEAAKEKGVDPKIVDSARADYRRAQALYDLDAQIKKTTLSTADPAKQLTNIKSLYTRLNGLADSGRLEEAVGPEKAKALLGHVEESSNAVNQLKQKATETAAQTKKLLAEHEASVKKQTAEFEKKTASIKSNRKWAGGVIIGGATAEGIHRLSGK